MRLVVDNPNPEPDSGTPERPAALATVLVSFAAIALCVGLSATGSSMLVAASPLLLVALWLVVLMARTAWERAVASSGDDA